MGQMFDLTITSGWEFHICYSFPSLTKQSFVQSNSAKPMGGLVAYRVPSLQHFCSCPQIYSSDSSVPVCKLHRDSWDIC